MIRILALVLILQHSIFQITCLRCFTCSTLAGDRYCTEDNFNGKRLKVITCPLDNDICVRMVQRNDQNVPSGVIRSCAKSNTRVSEHVSDYGFFAPSGTCLTYKGSSRNNFVNSTVTLCSCAQDLGNGKEIENC